MCFAGRVSRRLRKRKIPAKLTASDDKPAQAGIKRKTTNTAQRGDKQMPAQPGRSAAPKCSSEAVQSGICSLNNDLLLLVFSQLEEVRLCHAIFMEKPLPPPCGPTHLPNAVPHSHIFANAALQHVLLDAQ